MKCNYAMKFTGMAVALFISFSSFSQVSEGVAAGFSDLQVQPIKLPSLAEVGGSPYMTAEYQMGTIEISDNRLVKNIPVKFNMFNNAVMVAKDGQDLKLELFETVTFNDGSDHKITLKQGYPEIDNHSDKSVYQVLSMGPKVHLIKFYTQKIEDAATLGDYSRREIVTTPQLYIYTPGGEIKKIKASKQSLVDALPALSAKIEEVVAANKLNLKSESGLTELIEALNKP